MKQKLACLICGICLLFSHQLQSKQLPVESFSRLPMFERPKLSPAGDQVAFISNLQDQGLAILTTVDLKTGKKNFLIIPQVN